MVGTAAMVASDRLSRTLLIHEWHLVGRPLPVIHGVNRAAFAARAHWLIIEWLPKHVPDRNDIGVVWHDLKAHNLAQQTFTGVAERDGAIHEAVNDLNRGRMVVPLAKPRISA